MRNASWKFENIKFPKPDLEAFRLLYKDAIERVEEAESEEDLLEIIFENNELARRARDLLTATFIHHTMDTEDEVYAEGQKWVDENQHLFTEIMLEFSEAVYNSPYRGYVEEKIGPMYFAKMETRKKTFSHENVPLRQREAQLTEEYQSLIATCQKEVAGETRNFMSLQSLFSHEDRGIRKEAFGAFSNFLEENEEKLEAIWEELITVRNQIGKNLGYENYLPVGYLERERLDYGQEEVAQFRKQVQEEIVPLCNKLYEAQARRLGIDKVMAYDEKIVFPDGNGHPVGDADYMMNEMLEILREMSPETDEYIDFMLDHNLIDYESRPNKAAMAYSTMISSRKAPFIFAHFQGFPADVQFMSEGFGHTFAAYRAARKQPLDDYYASSSDIMEIHSMSMTQFFNKHADRLFGEDSEKYRFSVLQSLMTFIPFGVAVDEFQHICYQNPELTPKERTREWKKIEEKYMPWRKYDEGDEFMNRGGYWYHKEHFFIYPLYYVEYSLATVNAMEMNRKYIERPETAWKEFLELTDVGGSKGYLEILRHANLTPAYQEGAVAKSISYVKGRLEEFMEKSK